MCTVKEIREAIREDCHSQHDMESAEIDRVLQTLPFSQGNDLLDKPPILKLVTTLIANTKGARPDRA